MFIPWSFSPLVLRPALWLDASDASTIYSGSSLAAPDGAISQWLDKSGNGHHATQSTGVSQALRKTGIKNGRDLVRFDGANDFFYTPGLGPLSIEYTIFTVFKSNSPSATQCVVYNGFTGSNGYGLYLISSQVDVLQGGVAILSDGSSNTNFESVSIRRNSSVNAMTRNGASASLSGNAAPNASTGAIGIGGPITSGNTLDGDIAEILFFDFALSDLERTAIESYLNAKWSIY